MQIDEMVQYLIGVGASIGVDCEACLKTCIAMARECGADEEDIAAARAVGEKVKACAGKMAGGLNGKFPNVKEGFAACCGSAEINS